MTGSTGDQPVAPVPSGVPAVDDAVALLAELDTRPVAEHVAVLDDVHGRLQDALASLDDPGERP